MCAFLRFQKSVFFEKKKSLQASLSSNSLFLKKKVFEIVETAHLNA